MPPEAVSPSHYLGQFIPLHYHHNMLLDRVRMDGFRAAIAQVVRPGDKVLELGGGTGVLSFFAAQTARKVWCVEVNPELVAEARRLLDLNPGGERVEVVHADAMDYLPPEPVDVVICEMLHTALLREKQVEVIESFKQRYRARFGEPLPVFLPEAIILAVQPVQQHFEFSGYHAPIILFQQPALEQAHTLPLAEPQVYATLDFQAAQTGQFKGQWQFNIQTGGQLTALCFLTKALLAVDLHAKSTTDWLMSSLIIPLNAPHTVKAGDTLHVAFDYAAGDTIQTLQQALKVEVFTEAAGK